MILPRGFPGVAFGEASDGDPRYDETVRRTMSEGLGIAAVWATIDQVHGADILVATDPGRLGEADGIASSAVDLPIAIATADCVPVVLRGDFTIAVAHAGWRGIASGVVEAAVRAVSETGDVVRSAVLGPHIGPCCYAVTPSVVDAIGGHGGTTTTGRLSADLSGAVHSRLPGIEISGVESCTMHDNRFFSYRRNGTGKRQVTVAWISQD